MQNSSFTLTKALVRYMVDEKLKKDIEKKIAQQFSRSLDQSYFEKEETFGTQAVSQEYAEFRKESRIRESTLFEQMCNWCGQTVPISPDGDAKKQLESDLEICNIHTTPEGITSFSLVFPLAILLILVPLIYVLTGNVSLIVFALLFILAMIIPLQQYVPFKAQTARLEAGNQMILGVFYIATYMRHTSNLERAIEFASLHMPSPLNQELRKVLWDIETQRFDTVIDSTENFLMRWKPYYPEFVESMHIIMSSLYEGNEEKRVELLDKALDLILDETYDKMLHYAHNLQSPINALHMLGIVLPILGLIMLPIAINFMPELEWYYIMLLYNVVLPVMIFLISKNIMGKRPASAGGIQLSETNPEVIRRRSNTILILGTPTPIIAIPIVIIIIGLLIGFSSMILHALNVNDMGFGDDAPKELFSCGKQFCLLEYKKIDDSASPDFGKEKGPYAMIATLLSLAIPLSVAIGLGLYYKIKSGQLMKLRNETQALEDEFVGALFQLSNRLGDGMPAEIAFSKVASGLPNTRSGAFFELISVNIQKLGMGLDEAIFHPKSGALVYYPSTLIESSMKILTQSAQKGPLVASRAINNVARYVREMHRVDERLQDLMAEVLASMKSQINFLTPIISGIVIGITAMITAIIGKLKALVTVSQPGAGVDAAQFEDLFKLFGDGVPPIIFSIIVSVYVVQVIILLTQLVVAIQRGVDPVMEKDALANNLLKSAILYVVIALIVILVFNVIAINILLSVGTQ